MNRIDYYHSSGLQHLFKIIAQIIITVNNIVQFHLRPHLIHKHLQVVLGIRNDGETYLKTLGVFFVRFFFFRSF